jgi:hypothetical protein
VALFPTVSGDYRFKGPEQTTRSVDAPIKLDVRTKYRAVKQQQKSAQREDLVSRIHQQYNTTEPREDRRSPEGDGRFNPIGSTDETSDNERASEKSRDGRQQEENDDDEEDTNEDISSKNQETNTEKVEKGSIEGAVSRLDELTYAWNSDGGENKALRALAERQAQVLEEMGVEVTFPEVGTEYAYKKHEVAANRPSDEPPGTMLFVARLGLRGDDVDERTPKVIVAEP